MPEQTVHCSICGKPIRGYDFPKRMAKLRRHYKKMHPKEFRDMVKKGVAKRKGK